MTAVFCSRCGTSTEGDDKFCSTCGATLRRPTTQQDPDQTIVAGGDITAPAENGFDPALKPLLEAAMSAATASIDDFAANRIDEATLRSKLFEAGLIVRDGEAWLLDIERGRWCRYDGIAVEEPVIAGTAG